MKKAIEKTYIRNSLPGELERGKTVDGKIEDFDAAPGGGANAPATSISKHALKCLLVNIF